MNKRSLIVLCGVWLILPVGGRVQAADGVEPAVASANGPTGAASVLVRQALEAEIEADAEARAVKLKAAQQQDPTFAPAKWHAGLIRVGEAWLKWQDAHQADDGDARLKRYRSLRAQSDLSPAAHVKLAQWCARNDLADQSRAHWTQVLIASPSHRGALAALGLVWYQGRLLSKEDKQRLVDQTAKTKKDLKNYKSQATRWRRSILKGKDAQREAALAELDAVEDPEAITEIAAVFWEEAASDERSEQMHLALLGVAARFKTVLSTRLLFSYAVLAESEKIRDAAIYALKELPMHEYVPQLLSRMAAPVEVGTAVSYRGNRVVNTYSFSRQGPKDTNYDTSYTTSSKIRSPRYGRKFLNFITPGYDEFVPESQWGMCGRMITVEAYMRRVPDKVTTVRDGYSDSATDNYRAEKQGAYRKFQTDTLKVQRYVDEINRTNQEQNERIASVLKATTGKELVPDAKSWWDWWQKYLDENPAIRLATIESGGPFAAFQWDHHPGSFPEGTLVWTTEGATPIQDVMVGDGVLSQDPVTGELAYKVVADVARSGEIPMQLLRVEPEESLITAPGNLIWSAGEGWRMAHDLKAGALLHGVQGSRRLTDNMESNARMAYRLVVLDFHTLFVGQTRVLVRDATVPPRTDHVLPGLASK